MPDSTIPHSSRNSPQESRKDQVVVALVGPESCGKSVLATQLAQQFGCPLVPEMARQILQGQGPPYESGLVESIGRAQQKAEEHARSGASRHLICDTNLLVIRVWMEEAFGSCPDWIIRETETTTRYDLHLLLYPDLPWEPDPLREHPHDRIRLFHRYESLLRETGQAFEIVRGQGKERFENARNILEKRGLLFP